jgi:hypothetical protein
MQNTKDFLLELGQLKLDHVAQLSVSFGNLPKSDYLDGDYRLRRYSRFNFSENVLKKMPAKAFEQSTDFNDFQGNVERKYEEIEQNIIASEAFVEMFSRFKDITNLDDGANIEVHQIRIIAKGEKSSQVTPEGVHQDGYQRIGIFVIDGNNIIGGELNIHTQKHAAPFIKHKFDQGEFVVLNDEHFWHSAEDIRSAGPGGANMDVFVLTA